MEAYAFPDKNTKNAARASHRQTRLLSIPADSTLRPFTTEGTETPVRAARKEACERIRFARFGHDAPTFNLKSAVQRRRHLAEARRRGGLMDFLMESEFLRQTIDEIPFTNEAIAKPR